MKIKLQNVEEIFYLAFSGTEHLLIKVRGRGWFISSGPCDAPECTPERMKAWLLEDSDTFERITVIPFFFEQPDQTTT